MMHPKPSAPSRSFKTCCAFVGLGLPEELAEGADNGRLEWAIRARVRGWEGMRIAFVWGAGGGGGDGDGNSKDKGPGQKALIRAR